MRRLAWLEPGCPPASWPRRGPACANVPAAPRVAMPAILQRTGPRQATDAHGERLGTTRIPMGLLSSRHEAAQSSRARGRSGHLPAPWCSASSTSSSVAASRAVSEGRLLRITHDDYVHVVYKVNQLKKDPPASAVYIFGGSGAMETVVGERSLARQIEPGGWRSGHCREPGQPRAVAGPEPRHRRQPPAGQGHAAHRPRAHALHTARRPPTQACWRRGRCCCGARASPSWDGSCTARRPPSWVASPGAFDFISAYMKERVSSGPFPGGAPTLRPALLRPGCDGRTAARQAT